MQRIRKVPSLPARPRDAHKGSCGRVLIVGGCRGMAGAVCLAARAALRGGAGLVKVVVPEPIWDVVATKLDECTTGGRAATADGTFAPAGLEQIWHEEQGRHHVTVLGPGIGPHPETAKALRHTVCMFREALVLDADGLNAFANLRIAELGDFRKKYEAGRTTKSMRADEGPRSLPALVLTPHPGEAARMLKTTNEKVQAEREGTAAQLSELTHGGVVLLKGPGTVVADGARVYVNKSGNPGMATGGSGDVLSGLIGALVGQGMDAFDAACLGAYLHGLAGDLAAKALGTHSLTAGDIVAYLPHAFMKHGKARKK